MPQRMIIYALAGVWALLFAASFVMGQLAMEGRDEYARALNRLASLLTWQGLAFAVAVALAFLTYRAVARGQQKVKLVGYAPLAISVFLLASFILIIAYRFFVAPLLPS